MKKPAVKLHWGLSSLDLILRLWMPLASAIAIAGCASVSVQPRAGTESSKKAAKPKEIIVAPFTIPSNSSIRVDRSGKELADLESKLKTTLQQELVKDLKPFGIAVRAADSKDESQLKQPTGPAWLITGEFTKVNQGSRALRFIVGLGAGGTKMETNVRILDLSVRNPNNSKLLAEFKTTGGSNAEPGAVINAAATMGYGAVINVVSIRGINEDARRTARMIADYVSEELAARGVIPADKAVKAKRLAGN